jgi:hypothetical protein
MESQKGREKWKGWERAKGRGTRGKALSQKAEAESAKGKRLFADTDFGK